MNKVVLFLACASLTVSGAYAQKKLVDEVRKDVSALTTNVDTYKAAINKLKPAFSNPETKDNVETWMLVATQVSACMTNASRQRQSASRLMTLLPVGHCWRVMTTT